MSEFTLYGHEHSGWWLSYHDGSYTFCTRALRPMADDTILGLLVTLLRRHVDAKIRRKDIDVISIYTTTGMVDPVSLDLVNCQKVEYTLVDKLQDTADKLGDSNLVS